jgi:hypothetical protein
LTVTVSTRASDAGASAHASVIGAKHRRRGRQRRGMVMRKKQARETGKPTKTSTEGCYSDSDVSLSDERWGSLCSPQLTRA